MVPAPHEIIRSPLIIEEEEASTQVEEEGQAAPGVPAVSILPRNFVLSEPGRATRPNETVTAAALAAWPAVSARLHRTGGAYAGARPARCNVSDASRSPTHRVV